MTSNEIKAKTEKIMLYISEDYLFDNPDILLERSKLLLNYQSDMPSLIFEAQSLKSDCELTNIEIAPMKRKILCSKEHELLDFVKNAQKALSQASKTTQSQLAILRAELEATMRGRDFITPKNQ